MLPLRIKASALSAIETVIDLPERSLSAPQRVI